MNTMNQQQYENLETFLNKIRNEKRIKAIRDIEDDLIHEYSPVDISTAKKEIAGFQQERQRVLNQKIT